MTASARGNPVWTPRSGAPEYENPHALQENRHADVKSVHLPESSGNVRTDYFFSAAGSMRTGLWISNRLLRSKYPPRWRVNALEGNFSSSSR